MNIEAMTPKEFTEFSIKATNEEYIKSVKEIMSNFVYSKNSTWSDNKEAKKIALSLISEDSHNFISDMDNYNRVISITIDYFERASKKSGIHVNEYATRYINENIKLPFNNTGIFIRNERGWDSYTEEIKEGPSCHLVGGLMTCVDGTYIFIVTLRVANTIDSHVFFTTVINFDKNDFSIIATDSPWYPTHIDQLHNASQNASMILVEFLILINDKSLIEKIIMESDDAIKNLKRHERREYEREVKKIGSVITIKPQIIINDMKKIYKRLHEWTGYQYSFEVRGHYFTRNGVRYWRNAFKKAKDKPEKPGSNITEVK
jgi:hypothetical protein